jgi:hypothetical protein
MKQGILDHIDFYLYDLFYQTDQLRIAFKICIMFSYVLTPANVPY